MNVSITELSDLCKKVFEGMGFPTGDYEDCTQAITWLEMHGLPILSEIYESDPTLSIPKSQAATVLFEDETLAVLNAHENGGLIYGSLALDLAYLKALQSGFSVVKLQNPHHCQLIIPRLVQCAQRSVNQRSISAVVRWREGQQEHVVTMQAHSHYPCYTIYQAEALSQTLLLGQTQSLGQAPPSPNRPQQAQTLSILCMTDFALTQPLADPAPTTTPLFCMMPNDFATQRQHHNEAGLEIDEAVWTQLIALAENVLVEATLLSRLRGAGESAENPGLA